MVGNDISGFADPDYLAVCAGHGASVVATHIRLGPRVPDPEPIYDDVVVDVREFLRRKGADALAAGIPPERIMVDDGLDLGKTEPQSLELLRTSERLAALGYPAFLSASNKRFLGELLGPRRQGPARGQPCRPRHSASPRAVGSCGPTTCGALGARPTGRRAARGTRRGLADQPGRDIRRARPMTGGVHLLKGADPVLLADAARDLIGHDSSATATGPRWSTSSPATTTSSEP